MKDCIFCKIISGDIPCMKVYEDDIVLAYLDINPDSDGHTLIIPKEHYKDINDIPDKTLLHIYKTSKKIMKILEEKLGCDGFSLLQNNGSIQEVKHYHLHVKPYYKNKKQNELIKHKELIKDPKEIYELIKEAN
ncbi:MAG: HIT family protein [Bacilli bacterium]|nr:HIT family protein [Bacilli bacterium]